MAFAIKINGNTHSVDVDGDTPLARAALHPTPSSASIATVG
jgi:hypothetical protein